MISAMIASPSIGDIKISMILGGFGLFLLGIKLLGDGFKLVAGPKIRDYIEKYTSNIFSAILVGAVITALMQSSTAATVISISLVRAGLMGLTQAIGISVGANLGTTVTAIMIGFNVEEYGFYLVFIAALMLLFIKNKKIRNYGQILFALGITFVGLELMSDQLIILQTLPQFESFLVKMAENPWLALLAGTIATAVINSSSAVIALVQKIYAGGGMTMAAASGFVFGSNVGTTLTAVLASIGGSVSTKRTGWFHALYNVIGAVITMLVIYPYSKFILMLSEKMGAGPEMAIGINHFVFNLVWVVGIIPLIPLSIKILEFLIPGEDSRKELTKFAKLDYDLIQTLPEAAIRMAKDQTLQMGQLVEESLHMTQNYLKNHDEEDIEVIEQFEEITNQLDRQLINYLIAIGKDAASGAALTKDFIANLEIVKNIERIGDISTNLGEFYQRILENKETLSDDAMEDLDAMYGLVFKMIERAFLVFKTGNLKEFDNLMKDEEKLNLMNQDFREKHFRRIADGITTTEIISSVFVDILGSLERIGDHAVNIVELSVREA